MGDPVKPISFDTSQIGEADKRNLCSTFLSAIERFYENPVNQKRFEQWQQSKQRETHTPVLNNTN